MRFNHVFLFALTAVFLFACTQVSDADKTVKIGFVGALTGDGASFGISSQEGAQMAVEEINVAGGIHGTPLQIIYEDGRCSAEGSNTATQKLVTVDRVQAIIYGSCDGEFSAAAPFLEQNKVIGIATYPSSPDITNYGDYLFRNSYNDAISGRVLAEDMIHHYKKLAMISELNTYSQALKQALRKEFEERGGIIVADEDFQAEMRDFRTTLLKIFNQKPDVIFVNPDTPVTGSALLRQLKELSNTKPLYSNFFLSGDTGRESSGEAAEGVVFIADPDPNGKQADALFEKYRERYGKNPAFPYPFSASYDAVYLLTSAIREKGYDATAIKEWLYSLPEYDGTLGKYHFDENGDEIGIQVELRVVKNGRAEKIKF
ncbi:MAG: ABC transporter substrate-binding protein [Nanoarchaeota archaeon]